MNILLSINGLTKVDFIDRHLESWVRNPSIELCCASDDGIDLGVAIKWFRNFKPVPFENVIEYHVEEAVDLIEEFIKVIIEKPLESHIASGCILLSYRPIPPFYPEVK